MNRRLRIDIVQNDQVLIFQNDLCRNFAGRNFFEQCHLIVSKKSVFQVSSFQLCAKEVYNFVSQLGTVTTPGFYRLQTPDTGLQTVNIEI